MPGIEIVQAKELVLSDMFVSLHRPWYCSIHQWRCHPRRALLIGVNPHMVCRADGRGQASHGHRNAAILWYDNGCLPGNLFYMAWHLTLVVVGAIGGVVALGSADIGVQASDPGPTASSVQGNHRIVHTQPSPTTKTWHQFFHHHTASSLPRAKLTGRRPPELMAGRGTRVPGYFTRTGTKLRPIGFGLYSIRPPGV